tara:strand:+ start:102 stop:818 length:717 start_codon:yes stop_codon:yes gene_type:complete
MNISNLLPITPKYELTIPSTKEIIKFRPFLVKEEKILLLAQQSNNNATILTAIKTIIEDCTDGIQNAGELPLFDVEYIFLQLRAKSIGELIEPSIICPETDEKIDVQININDMQVLHNKTHTKNIKIDNNVIIGMKYPSLNILQEKNHPIDSLDPISFYDLLVSCIENIQTPDENISVADNISDEEISQFVDNLTKSQFETLLDFFITSPRLEHTVQYTTSDGQEREVVLSGLSDFFG